MPPSDSQAFLRELFLRSDDTPVVSKTSAATETSNLAGHHAAKQPATTGLIATIPFQHADLHAKEILGQFALAEGKKGGHRSGATKTSPQGSPKGWRGGANQYFTPKSIVSLIVEMIEPYQGRVYDPAMGSGGFFVRNTRPSGVRFAKRCRASARGVVQSERFIEEHGGTIGDIMVFGQDQWAWGAHLRRAQRARRVRLRRKQPNQCNPTTWRLAAMNMDKSLPRQSETATGGLPRHSATTPGIDFDFGKEPADTFTRDQHPDLAISKAELRMWN